MGLHYTPQVTCPPPTLAACLAARMLQRRSGLASPPAFAVMPQCRRKLTALHSWRGRGGLQADNGFTPASAAGPTHWSRHTLPPPRSSLGCSSGSSCGSAPAPPCPCRAAHREGIQRAGGTQGCAAAAGTLHLPRQSLPAAAVNAARRLPSAGACARLHAAICKARQLTTAAAALSCLQDTLFWTGNRCRWWPAVMKQQHFLTPSERVLPSPRGGPAETSGMMRFVAGSSAQISSLVPSAPPGM